MATDQLSEKERAFLEAARREAAAKRAGDPGRAPDAKGSAPARPPAPKSARASTRLDQPTVLGWDHPAANAKPGAAVPLDQPTVLGWDNPAAREDPATEKWERIARLMAEEREAAEAARRRVKRYGLVVSAALFAVGIVVVLALWPKPGA